MPPLPVVPGVLKCRYRFTIGEDANATVGWNIAYTGTAPDDTTCSTIASDIFTEAVSDWADLMADNTVLTGVDIEDLSSTDGGFGSHAGTGTGTGGDDFLPAGAATMINFPIARRYRGGKPRSYFPFGLQSSLEDAQTWTTGWQSAVFTGVGAVLAYVNGLAVAGTTLDGWRNVSYYQGFTSVLNPITGRTRDVPKVRTGSIPVDAPLTYSVHPKVASQRRRNLTRT